VLPNSFSAVPRSSGPVLMFRAPRLVFGGSEGVACSFYFLRSLSSFRRYRGRRVPFSCFALPDSFSSVPRASSPVFMSFTLGLIFVGSVGVITSYHVLCSQTHFRPYRGRRVPFSCFAPPDSILAVPRASGLIFMFYAPGLVFDGSEGVESSFHVLCSQTHFRRNRIRRVLF
jgi:hypothetical protein